MRSIIRVVPRKNYLLELEFESGEVRIFDLKPYLRGSLFEPLKDENLFRQVHIEESFGGLIWPNGADLCPDMLHMNSLLEEAAAFVA